MELVDIYLAALRLSEYPQWSLLTYTSYIPRDTKNLFISVNIRKNGKNLDS